MPQHLLQCQQSGHSNQIESDHLKVVKVPKICLVFIRDIKFKSN